MDDSRYLPVVYDTEREQLVVEDEKVGDFVTPTTYELRRVWSHYCRLQALHMRYTKYVTECPKCKENRPDA